MKEIKINVDSYNSDSINTIQGNNNAEVYKIYVLFNKRRIDLTGKTVKMAYLRTGTVEGDVINLNITNATEGEITLQITNKISKKDGVYSCQLAIYGADGFLEHTATFGLTVEANIFTKIAGEIENSKDFTYLENILDKASKLSEKLKENTSTATNANSNLESNITEANNINSKLLENTSTATSLNKNLESNIDLAKEVKETIKDLDTKNIEATSKIERLEGLNAKAEELSNNINEALPVKDALVKNTEEAKAANTNLLAVNQEATTKNTELQASLEKTKEFINGLDGSQNIPQLRLDVTELQNGLKSNQALSYQGSSMSANDTLEGRTEGMKVKGKTMYKKKDGTYTDTWEEGVTLESFGEAEGNKISILSHGKNLFNVNNSEQGLLNVNNGELFKTDTSDTSDYIKVGKEKKYIINGEGGEIRGYYGVFYDANKNYIEHKTFSKNIPFTFEQEGYFRFSYASKEDNLPATNIIFLEGTQATQYEEYKENKKDILIKKPLGEWDYIYEDNGQVKIYRETFIYTFNGDEDIDFYTINANFEKGNFTFVYNLEKKAKDSTITDIKNLICDTLTAKDGNNWDDFGKFIQVNNNRIFFSMKGKEYKGVNDFNEALNIFKAWLKTNPTTIVYQLAEPTVEVVENCVDIDLDTFGEKTYFNILNSIKGSLDFKVPSNLGSSLQNLAKEVNNIWDVINNLLVPSILDVNKKVALATIKNNLK